MHKAKENANSTFSIGKTWVLDDLTVIQSFTNAVPQTAEEQQDKQRAGATGFVVTVQKPYYWSAHTAKEKDFFILSLLKIFKKYTGGRLPTLIGFDSAELQQLGGVPGAAKETTPTSQPSVTDGPTIRVPSQERPSIREPRIPNLPPETSRERRPRPSQERSFHERPPPQQVPQERPPQERQLHSTITHPLQTAKSNERIHMPGSFPSTDSVNDVNQQRQLRTKRSESPAILQPKFQRPGPAQSTESFRSGQESYDSRSSNDRPRPNASYSSSSLAVNPVEDRPLTAVRDTRGPSPLSQEHGLSKPAPVLNYNPPTAERPPDQAAPRAVGDTRNGHRRDNSASSRGSNRGYQGPPSSDDPGTNVDSVADGTRSRATSSHSTQSRRLAPQEARTPTPVAIDGGASVPQPPATTFPPTPPPETPTEEVHRPGLGPMIRSKKSTNEVATKFRKAATAYNAFKPRAGGAVEKLKDENSTGGDGITGVFQAPSLLRAMSHEDTRPATPKESVASRPATPESKKEIPSVNITASPLKPAPTIIPEPLKPVASIPPEIPAQIVVEPQQPPPIPDKAHEERRKKRQSDHSAKYAKVLGINPSLLEGRTFEMETVLNDFGWGEERNQRIAFEELESGIRKELARVEAGSWLSAVENNDDRAIAAGNMMDRVIAECEELDCLLTLYNVELGVSSRSC